jgi:hypothetical protein
MKLILFTDKDYYSLSGTMLSPIVHDRDSVGEWDDPHETHELGERSDWGKVTLALDAGLTVAFRKATPSEIQIHTDHLMQIRRSRMEDPSCTMDPRGFPVYEVKPGDRVGIVLKKALGVEKIQGGGLKLDKDRT